MREEYEREGQRAKVDRERFREEFKEKFGYDFYDSKGGDPFNSAFENW
jgi:hypothetical protein